MRFWHHTFRRCLSEKIQSINYEKRRCILILHYNCNASTVTKKSAQKIIYIFDIFLRLKSKEFPKQMLTSVESFRFFYLGLPKADFFQFCNIWEPLFFAAIYVGTTRRPQLQLWIKITI